MTDMTSTTTPAKTSRQEHDQPCFCDLCLPCTLYDLLDQQAAILRAAFADRLYTEGLERDLADEVIAAIPAASRAEVLAFTLEWDHLSMNVMGVHCLLDECDHRSYEVLGEMAKILLAAIYAQNEAPHALRHLITQEICNRARLWD